MGIFIRKQTNSNIKFNVEKILSLILILLLFFHFLISQGNCHTKLSENKSGEVLTYLKVFPCEFLENLLTLVYPHLHKPQPAFSHDYYGLTRVPDGYAMVLLSFISFLCLFYK